MVSYYRQQSAGTKMKNHMNFSFIGQRLRSLWDNKSGTLKAPKLNGRSLDTMNIKTTILDINLMSSCKHLYISMCRFVD